LYVKPQKVLKSAAHKTDKQILAVSLALVIMIAASGVYFGQHASDQGPEVREIGLGKTIISVYNGNGGGNGIGNIPWLWIIALIIIVFLILGLLWWFFVIAKRRKEEEEDEENQKSLK
jgi:flagellar basal body-associated protein FliL